MAINSLTGKDPVAVAIHRMGSIEFLRSGAYVNLSDIAKPFGKRVDNWMRLKTTKELIAHFESSPIYSGDPAFVIREGRAGGTFAHPDIAKKFEQWCKSRKANKPTCVYLLWAIGSNVFKIGIAANAFTRMKQLQVGSPLQLNVTRAHPCDDPKKLEKKLHEVFKPYFSHGEWFEADYRIACKLFDQTVSKWTVADISQHQQGLEFNRDDIKDLYGR